MSATIYYDDSADLTLLDGKKITFVGYGNQGRSQALNLRDTLKARNSTAQIVISNIEDSYAQTAVKDGFGYTTDFAGAVKGAHAVFLLIPDQVQPALFNEQIAPNMAPGSTLVVASGYNAFYGLLNVPETSNVVMIAPRMIGESVRTRFVSKEGFPVFVSVEKDATGDALATTLALSCGIGATKAGAISSSAKEEILLDLFAEQALWPSIIASFREAYKLLKANGCSDEALVIEMWQSKEPAEIFEKASEDGFVKQLKYHSSVSQFGQLYGSTQVDTTSMVERFKRVLQDDILGGAFAKRFTEMEAKGTLDAELQKLYDVTEETDLAQGESRVYKRLGLGKENNAN